MGKNFTRSLIMLLCISMIMALCGISAFAEDAAVASVGETTYPSLEEAFKAAKDGSTINLLSDDTVNNQIVVTDGKAVTLDLSGHNITSSANTAFMVNNGTITLTGTGKISASGEVFRVTGSRLTIENGVELDAKDTCVFYYGEGTEVNIDGKLTTDNVMYATIMGNGNESSWGTKLTLGENAVVHGTFTGIYHPQMGEVIINGSKISSDTSSAIEMRSGTLTINGNAKLSSKAAFSTTKNGDGETTTGAAVAVAPYTGETRAITLNISGGTFDAAKALSYANPNSVVNPDVTINVTGGTFSTDITDALTNAEVKSNIKEYAVAANADGTYGVKARDEKFENVAAVQRNTNNTLTFLAGINYLDYEKAGFRVTVGSNTKEINTDTVYTELKDNGATSVSADKFSTNYFFAANFEVTDTTIEEFTITPFAKLLNGEEVTGDSTTVKVEKTGGAE